MVNEYKKPRLSVTNWTVTKKDLRVIYNFLAEHFRKSEIEIHLESSGSESGIYNDFKKLDKALEKALKRNSRITSILFSAGHTMSSGIEKQRYIWLELRFDSSDAEFYLYAKDRDGSLENWANGTYRELQGLVALFEDRRNSTSKVVLNYHKGASKQETLLNRSIIDVAFTKGSGWYEDPIKLFSLFIGASGVTVSITSLMIQIIVNWNKLVG